MKFHLFISLVLVLLFSTHVYCKSDIHIGYSLTLEVPVVYSAGFTGRAFLIETDQTVPNFRAALSVEPIKGNYSCSLEVFLGDVKVWNSGHYSQFYTWDICKLELTKDGDLQLKGPKDRVGWRTGTSGQGVEKLEILETGNLVLADGLNRVKWQSFNFPTDVMLLGQRLNVATRLTSFTSNSSTFYSFEIQRSKLLLYLSFGKRNYSYWEYKPPNNRNITFVELGAKGLEVFGDEYSQIAQIPSSRSTQPLRFLALVNRTGNLGLYFYSPENGTFEAAFQALTTTCDLPLACRPYGICTFSNACSCIRLSTKEDGAGSDCNEGFSGGFCGNGPVEMLELNGATSVLRPASKRVNVSKEACEDFCLRDCDCLAALFSSGMASGSNLRECFLYAVVMGIKQTERGITGMTYMVKVPKGTHLSHGKSGVKKWVLVMVGVVDSLIILLVFGGLGYYLIHRRRKNRPPTDNNT
ncbi:hypothetical protein Tsubulata_015687 [Turnera subulata]|uniref:Bulb-type lectin domain-containing protein n=1 Tax=Turnera subulata TaxID=218843 RepID=A0A9Q0G1L1_9ROSI|nr:hypothetical protein Tsubulata_015687 [Turnera subulata]